MMDFFDIVQLITGEGAADSLRVFFQSIEKELISGLSCYWESAGRILRGSGVTLMPPPAEYFDLSRNFFSLLFLYSFHRGGISPGQRSFYVAVNQCLRGMVTGCDNLLDDEYKRTLETDLPEGGTRMRSVFDIMVSDRVLFDLLMDAVQRGEIPIGRAHAAGAASLRALTRSGAQEAGEEGGIDSRLPPEEILSRIHHYKTALLFQCVWAVPEAVETLPAGPIVAQKRALYDIGMGCQILDDMVDLAPDVRNGRHNYVASLITHAGAVGEDTLLASAGEADWLLSFPAAGRLATRTATAYMTKGLTALFTDAHQVLIEPAIRFVAGRIGADRFLTAWAE